MLQLQRGSRQRPWLRGSGSASCSPLIAVPISVSALVAGFTRWLGCDHPLTDQSHARQGQRELPCLQQGLKLYQNPPILISFSAFRSSWWFPLSG